MEEGIFRRSVAIEEKFFNSILNDHRPMLKGKYPEEETANYII